MGLQGGMVAFLSALPKAFRCPRLAGPAHVRSDDPAQHLSRQNRRPEGAWDSPRTSAATALMRSGLGFSALLLLSTTARASHERPWLADTHPARIAQVTALPGNANWRQALPFADGSVIVLREPDPAESGSFLARLSPGAAAAAAFIPDWATAPSGSRGADRFAPSALAHDEKGGLWLIDGSGTGAPPRLMRLDPVRGTILAEFPLPPEGVTPASRFTALAVHGEMAYLADEGGACLTVIDMRSRQATRFFSGYPTSRGHRPLVVNRQTVKGADGLPLTRDLSWLALENNGLWLYEQAPTGPIYRLSTSLLTDPSTTPSELMEGVTEWRGTPTISGMTIDDKSTLYLTDISEGRLLSFDTGRHPHVLLVAPQLVHAGTPGWVGDGPSGSSSDKITHAGLIYVPAGHVLLRIALP